MLSQTEKSYGSSDERKGTYWDEYYSRSMDVSRPFPSQFATFVAGELERAHRVVEFGCGNGRDSLFFSSIGHQVVGVDASAPAVEHCTRLAASLGDRSVFLAAGIDDPALPGLVPDVAGPTAIYARFFLHAITELEEEAFLRCAAELTMPGDIMAVEYRTVRDQAQQKVTDSHYRRFISPPSFQLAAARFGFVVRYAVEGFGFAKYREDDAYVARSILVRE